jgi:hypothetical protein
MNRMNSAAQVACVLSRVVSVERAMGFGFRSLVLVRWGWRGVLCACWAWGSWWVTEGVVCDFVDNVISCVISRRVLGCVRPRCGSLDREWRSVIGAGGERMVGGCRSGDGVCRLVRSG